MKLTISLTMALCGDLYRISCKESKKCGKYTQKLIMCLHNVWVSLSKYSWNSSLLDNFWYRISWKSHKLFNHLRQVI